MSKALIVIGSKREGNCYNLANKIKESLKQERIVCKAITPGNQKFIYVLVAWIVMKQVFVILMMTCKII